MTKSFKKRPKAARGFSLIEVMIATVLLGLMSVLIMTSVNTSARAKDDAEHLSQRYQEARQALSRMSREISMAYLSKHMSSGDAVYITQFIGRKNSLYFSAFGHAVHQKDAKQSDEQVLGFYLANDKEGRLSLMRRIHPNLNLNVEKGGRSQVLCTNVTALEFSYFDNRLQKWQESWIADPTTPLGHAAPAPKGEKKEKEEEQAKEDAPKPWRLPAVVKITMTVLMEEGFEMKWVSEAEIPVQEPLDLN